MQSRRRPVFLDLHGRRSTTVNIAVVLITFAILAGGATVLKGVFLAPQLPPLKVASDPLAVDARSARAPLPRLQAHEPPLEPTRNRQVPPEPVSTLRLAFLSGEISSFSSLRRNAGELDGIIPSWLELVRSPDGVTVTSDPASEEVVRWRRANAPHLAVYPQIVSTVSGRQMAAAIAVPAKRAAIIASVAAYVAKNDFQGAVVDFSSLPASSSRTKVILLAELADAIRTVRGKLILAISPGDDSMHLSAGARLVDYVILKTHDRTLLRDQAGAPAGQGWFEDQVWSSLAAIPRSKLIAAVGSYAYEFSSVGTKRLLSVQGAWDIAGSKRASMTLEPLSLNESFLYHDNSGRPRRVWVLDAATAFNQAKSALAAGVAGIVLWKLGLEDPGVWNSLSRHKNPNEASLAAAGDVEPGLGSFDGVTGALLSVSPGRRGTRTFVVEPGLGLVLRSEMLSFPGEGRMVSWPAVDPKAVALTFDDGPDAQFTPKILDILREKGATATFYVVGSRALAAPGIMNRIYVEGHDIGNHSFSHANLFVSRPERIAAELNATQRIFEAQFRARSLLFRPPYASAGYEYLERAVELIRTASELGYLFGGIEVDPFDYFGTAELIQERVVSQVLAAKGQVVLLHDAGGSRQATIDALPGIIDDLRAAGYRFVTTHELVGLSRTDVMPPATDVTLATGAEAELRDATLRLVAWFSGALPTVAIATAVLGVVRLLLVVLAAVTRRHACWRADLNRPEALSVAVLVPAFNEEKVIAKTIQGLLSATLNERLEIIVIDDGSSDRTGEIVRDAFGQDTRVRLLRKSNGGKAAALNLGIDCTEAEVVVAIDGDTVLLPDAIERLVAPFQDPAVGAVAGKVSVGNRVNVITRFQTLEYAVSQNLDRRAFERFNAIGVVPGAIGAWRRMALLAVGGYSHDTLAEDADLTLAVQRAGWRVVAESGAVALTEVPETLSAFVRQRFRWTFGTLQVAFKHRAALIGRPSGVSLVTLPNVFVFQFGFTLLAPILDALLLVAVVLGGLSLAAGDNTGQNETLLVLAHYWLLFQAVDTMAVAVGVTLDGDRSLWRLVPLVLIQRFTYRQIMYWVALRALLAAVKGTFVGWGKLIRTGSVALPAPAKIASREGSLC